jgi:predicted Ser/Thr protein kinase
MQLTQVGKFKIVGKLGAGAMGEVFRALDPVLGREVAIKVVTGKLSEDAGARDRFLREAQAAATLNHPNIITVYDFGEEQGQAFMAMELLEGQDLRELLAKGTLTGLEGKVAIMEQILDGLAFAHSKGVVHRDLKPGNVHVLPNGQVKVMDFGLARRIAEDKVSTSVIRGTPYYMAPEQARGERATARSDVFSIGAMFYEVLSGHRPFTGPTIPAVLFAVAHREPPPLEERVPDIPPGLAIVVMRALAKATEARYADAGQMLQALRVAWAGGEVTAAPPGSAGDPAATSPARALGPPLSARPDTPPDMRAAIQEIEDYFADRVPPLMVADSVATFSGASVEGAAAEIGNWAERQQALSPDVPLVDLLFHALHKLGVIGEFQLVEKDKLIGFLRAAGEGLAAACPPGEDREHFRRALVHLGEAEMVASGPIEIRKRAEAVEPLVPTTPGLRRLSILEQRLRRESLARGPAADVTRRRIASQAIAAAAAEAKSETELEDHLRRLRSAGVASGAEQVFRNLGHELGDWAMPKRGVSDTADLGPSEEVKAMKKIVSLPEDPIEVARRYRHLVNAAIEQFNEGNLGRAVQMFELATRLTGEKKIDTGFVEPVLKKGHEALDPARLRQFMDKPDRHEQLQTVMAFFANGLGPEILLGQLETEERRDRRRLLLDLLVVHGDTARALASARLLKSMEKPASDFGRRNWIYLLRHVPRAAGDAPDAEIEAVGRLASPGNPAFLVKEALLHLGQVRHPRAAEVLESLLGAWEAELERKDLDEAAREEALAALDRIGPALARQATPGAWRALVDHALSGRPEFGDTAARLGELGVQDLSHAPQVVDALAHEIRGSLHRGVLGRLVGRKDQNLPALVGALGGTRTPAVRGLLDEVRKRYPGQEPGRAAARALETPPPAPAAVPGHSGELDAYGLPALLHRLAQGKANGTLNLLPKEGAGLPATVGFSHGRAVSARWGHREGEVAFYQLFERPFAGGFAFDAGALAAGKGALPELAELIREGVRRARELQRTSAVVPDDVPLEATGASPGTVVDEADYDLIVALWEKACGRVCVRQMETELTADAFRILRPLAQWLEEGALSIHAAPEPVTDHSRAGPGSRE